MIAADDPVAAAEVEVARRLERGDALSELRSFFRMPLRQKISHIHSSAFASN